MLLPALSCLAAGPPYTRGDRRTSMAAVVARGVLAAVVLAAVAAAGPFDRVSVDDVRAACPAEVAACEADAECVRGLKGRQTWRGTARGFY